jgi:hypothetical protein
MTTPNITEHTYDPAGSAAFPDVNASAAIGGGNQFFAGGPVTQPTTPSRGPPRTLMCRPPRRRSTQAR